jgi:DNA polymerase III sliding clamp (beta) subunit (PCNA family)
MQGVLFGCRLRAGKHPNIQALLDQHNPVFSLSAGKDDTKAALTRASNFVMSGTRWVSLTLDEETSLKIQAASLEDQTDIKDEVDTELAGGPFTKMQVTVALDYFANAVQTLGNEKVSLGFSPEKQKAMVVRGETRTEDDKLVVSSVYAISPIKPKK